MAEHEQEDIHRPLDTRDLKFAVNPPSKWKTCEDCFFYKKEVGTCGYPRRNGSSVPNVYWAQKQANGCVYFEENS